MQILLLRTPWSLHKTFKEKLSAKRLEGNYFSKIMSRQLQALKKHLKLKVKIR